MFENYKILTFGTSEHNLLMAKLQAIPMYDCIFFLTGRINDFSFSVAKCHYSINQLKSN